MNKSKKIILALFASGVLLVFTAFKTDYFEIAKQIEIYSTLFKELNMYYIDEINPAKLTEKAIDNMLNGLDPYTRFYDEQQVEAVKIQSAGEYSGIGATTKYIGEQLTIYELYKDMPADKAGLKVGDVITSVDGTPVQKDNKQHISNLLKGASETEVNLTVKRRGKNLNFSVKREKIEIDPVPHYQMIDDEIGYISFVRFNTKAAESVKKHFLKLKEQGMTKLILDLRGNPGGLLHEAIKITNFFIPRGEVVVTTRAKLKKWSEVYRTKNDPVDTEIPIVVLIDRKSASAAEIVSGSLQDFDRAVIVGDRSFGKGLVQRYRDLPYGTKLKLTISKYYTPSGRNIQELDYTHRNGAVIPKFSDKEREKFTTKNGRTVYGGGGIEPDIKVIEIAHTKATDALLKSDAIFNFVTDYSYKHPQIPAAKEFVPGNALYNAFIDYLKAHPESFKTQTELMFEKGLETAKTETYDRVIQASYKTLLNDMQKQKIKELETNKAEILHEIGDAVLKRYYYDKGAYENHIYHSPYILKAVSILKNPEKYNEILH